MKRILSFSFFALCYVFAMSQTVGSKVSLTAVDGKAYTGTITKMQGDKYNVKYDGFDFEAWLTGSQFTVTDNPSAAPIPNQNNSQKKEREQTTTKSNVPTQRDLEAWMDKYIAKQANPGSDGAVTYQILGFKVGSPRKWQFNDGGDPADGHNTTVYPVKLHFLQKIHYRTRTHVEDHDCVFTSFKDGFGDWKFGYSADPQTEKSYDEPADMK